MKEIFGQMPLVGIQSAFWRTAIRFDAPLEQSSNRTFGAANRPMKQDFYIHPSAIVDEDVKIGNNTKIWHFSHVQSNSKIGLTDTIPTVEVLHLVIMNTKALLRI